MADPTKYPTRIAPYGLRLPPDLKARVEASAAANNRSLNAEIVYALDRMYPAPKLTEEEEAMIFWLLGNVPKAELEEFILNRLEALGVTDQDIADGLIPGVSIRPKPQSDDDLPF